MVVESISILKCNIAAPMADLDIAFEFRDVRDRLGEFVSDCGRRHGTSWDLRERPVGQLRSLLLWELLGLARAGKFGIIRNVC